MRSEETIQAAIDKLTKLRQQSTPGDWDILDGGDRFIAWHEDPTSTGFDYVADEPVEFSNPGNGELICTLHATIDAQLDLLQRTLDVVKSTPGATGHVGPLIDLALAILGKQASE